MEIPRATVTRAAVDFSSLTPFQRHKNLLRCDSLRSLQRFLRIMMLSVTSQTSGKVKFWLLDTYLSPEFRDKATRLCEEVRRRRIFAASMSNIVLISLVARRPGARWAG